VAAVAAVPSPAAPARDGATHLETPRLVLRPPSVDDAETVFSSYAQDPAVSRYTSWAPHGRVENTREFLRFCEEGWARGTLCSWVIARRDDGRLVGMTDIRLDGHRGEIGYVLAQGAWGQGYATEVARAVVAWGLAQPALHRIWAVCDLENKAIGARARKGRHDPRGLPARVGRDARVQRPARRVVLRGHQND
jgi:ribosomal-protein-alanine N-acetyltransferase